MFCFYSTVRRPPSHIIPKHPLPSLAPTKTTGERVEDYFSGNSASAAFPFLHSAHILPHDNGCCCLGYCRRRRAPRRRRQQRSFAGEIEAHVCVRFARRRRAGIRTPPLCRRSPPHRRRIDLCRPFNPSRRHLPSAFSAPPPTLECYVYGLPLIPS